MRIVPPGLEEKDGVLSLRSGSLRAPQGEPPPLHTICPEESQTASDYRQRLGPMLEDLPALPSRMLTARY
jgi:hypothetical protein